MNVKEAKELINHHLDVNRAAGAAFLECHEKYKPLVKVLEDVIIRDGDCPACFCDEWVKIKIAKDVIKNLKIKNK